MSERVLLLELRERTGAAGNRYMSGWLGKASVVAFLDRDADQPTWQVFVSTPAPRQNGDQAERSPNQSPFTPRSTRRPSRRRATELPPGVLDDDVGDI